MKPNLDFQLLMHSDIEFSRKKDSHKNPTATSATSPYYLLQPLSQPYKTLSPRLGLRQQKHKPLILS